MLSLVLGASSSPYHRTLSIDAAAADVNVVIIRIRIATCSTPDRPHTENNIHHFQNGTDCWCISVTRRSKVNGRVSIRNKKKISDTNQIEKENANTLPFCIAQTPTWRSNQFTPTSEYEFRRRNKDFQASIGGTNWEFRWSPFFLSKSFHHFYHTKLLWKLIFLWDIHMHSIAYMRFIQNGLQIL